MVLIALTITHPDGMNFGADSLQKHGGAYTATNDGLWKDLVRRRDLSTEDASLGACTLLPVVEKTSLVIRPRAYVGGRCLTLRMFLFLQ